MGEEDSRENVRLERADWSASCLVAAAVAAAGAPRSRSAVARLTARAARALFGMTLMQNTT